MCKCPRIFLRKNTFLYGEICIFEKNILPLHPISSLLFFFFIYPAYIAKSDWRETIERESDRGNLGRKLEASPT